MQCTYITAVENKGPINTHFNECGITPIENVIYILGKPRGGVHMLLTLEVLLIKEFSRFLNTNDEYKIRTLTLKL